MLNLLVILSAIANFLGALFYVRSMFRGHARPNRVTWFLWTLIPAIAFSAALSEGATWSTVSIFMSGFTPLLVLCASFFIKGSYWKLSRLDYLCGFLSLLALLLWGITHNAFYAVVLSIAADTLAGLPTFIKIWKHPESESDATFMGGLVSSLCGLLVVQEWHFVEYGFPLYLALICVGSIVTLRLRKRSRKI